MKPKNLSVMNQYRNNYLLRNNGMRQFGLYEKSERLAMVFSFMILSVLVVTTCILFLHEIKVLGGFVFHD